MKTLALSVVILVTTACALMAQDFVAPQPQRRQVIPPPPGTGAKPPFQGMVGHALKTKQPLQLINPFAPETYGTGEQNMSTDEGAPYNAQTSLIVFGIEW